jgi:mannose-6-phosphate isomerase-like protein (cupin superfamily)
VKWCIEPGETPLFGPERGCAEFEQRVLRLEPGDEHRNEVDDEVLYVLSGSGSLTIGGDPTELSPGMAAYVARGTAWRVDEADDFEALSVLVRDPLPADGTTHSVIALDEQEPGEATAGRQFRLLATPDAGCNSVTQFVGYIPVGRAPDHFHTYDEVVFVLAGEGNVHVDGETAQIVAGSCVHLPARLVHCIENTGPGELRVLGVFRPAGSPAEAYYPDGTRARY